MSNQEFTEEEIADDYRISIDVRKQADQVIEYKSEQRKIVEAAIEATKKGDVKAVYDMKVRTALSEIRSCDLGDYVELRQAIKEANPSILLTELDRAVKFCTASHQTHLTFAKDALLGFNVRRWAPVYFEGRLYAVNRVTNLWEPLPDSKIYDAIARKNDGHRLCSTRDDYRGIKSCMFTMAGREDFFENAAVGLATKTGFHRVDGTEITVEPLRAAHRQRVAVSFDVRQEPTPLFDNFMHETFRSDDPEEEAQQKRLVQEIAGAIMLGITHRYQKAVLFYDPYGRAGKGTLETIFRNLVPASFISAVSPFNWAKEYHLMALAGARLNVVGELPDDQPIPAAQFKSVLGQDPQTGRNPGEVPVLFRCQAAHLFSSNHLINTRDHSTAFHSRWMIVEFPNSRLRLGLPVDPDVANRIVREELPGVAYWAMQGALRVLAQGGFSPSKVHDRLAEKWQRTSNSVEEFLHDICVLDERKRVKRKDFYRYYRKWCELNGRSPVSVTKFRELLLHNVKLGIRIVKVEGHEHYKGVGMQDADLDDIAPYKWG